MSKNALYTSEATWLTDPWTAMQVRRLTDPSILSHHMYFYNRMTTSDGQTLLICQDRGEGEGRQLFCLNLQTGSLRQITEGTGVGRDSAMFSPDDQTIFYQQDGGYYRMDAETLDNVCYYRTPEGWSGGPAGMSSDCGIMAVVETRLDTLPPKKDSPGWNFFALTCQAKPLCRLVTVNTRTGESTTVLEERCWLGHPQIRPGDDHTIMFCHEGPYDLIDARLWLIDTKTRKVRCCRQQPNDLILTHEFWLPDGSKLAYVYRETTGDKIENIRMMNPDTLEEEIFMPCSSYAHFICDPLKRFMVGDAQTSDKPIHLLTDEDIRRMNDGPGNNFIYLVDMEKKTERKLTWHGTSWSAKFGSPQDTHPHPCFSADGKSVIFVSDREGKPCIYQVFPDEAR